MSRNRHNATMNDESNIHLAGIQINFNTWERFNLDVLSSDGVVLFQYLVFHCQHNAEWTHSDKSLEYELGIGRRRLESIRKLFVSIGFLETHIVRDRNDNRVRAYRINFLELTKLPVLKQLYREQNEKGEIVNLISYVQIYKSVAAMQPKTNGSKREQAQQASTQATTKGVANRMITTFDDRRKMYNSEIEKNPANKNKLRIAVGSIKFGPKHLRQLANAIRAINDNEFILRAFTAYCDKLNAHTNTPTSEDRQLLPNAPRDPLAYFLSYSTGTHTDNPSSTDSLGFSVIYTFGNFMASHYGRNV